MVSAKLIVNGITPVVSPPCIVIDAVHVVLLPETEAERPAIVTVGVVMVSLEVNERVVVSFTFAREVFALFEAMVTGERVGRVLSKVTELPFVTVDT